jgi:hypothetical protein
MEYPCLKRRRNMSIETLYDSDHDHDSNINDITNIIDDISNLNIKNNNEQHLELLAKINSLEKKVDELSKVNIKIDTMQKSIDKILSEKDYVIEHLQDEIATLKDDIRESKSRGNESISSKKVNDYFC